MRFANSSWFILFSLRLIIRIDSFRQKDVTYSNKGESNFPEFIRPFDFKDHFLVATHLTPLVK